MDAGTILRNAWVRQIRGDVTLECVALPGAMASDVSGAGTALETGGRTAPPETMQWERGRRLT